MTGCLFDMVFYLLHKERPLKVLGESRQAECYQWLLQEQFLPHKHLSKLELLSDGWQAELDTTPALHSSNRDCSVCCACPAHHQLDTVCHGSAEEEWHINKRN